MATAEEYAQWIVANPQLKGTDKFNTVAEAYKEAKAIETLSSGGQEYANESVLYEKPQVGVGRKLLQSGIKGLTGTADIVAGFPENVSRLAQYATTKGMPVPNPAAPIQTALVNKGILTPEAEFNTPVGRVADFTTQLMTGGGINPRTVSKSLMEKPLMEAGKDISMQFARTGTQGLVGGSTSEALKSVGIDSPIAQFLATGGTTAAAGAPFALRHTAADVANQATRNVTPQQLDAAKKLVEQSYLLKAPITGAEALAKVTGSSPLIGVQRVVENLPDSSETMATFMAKRPEANKQMVANALRNISSQQPTSATPVNLRNAAGNLIAGAEKSLTENVKPLYNQAGSVAVYPAPSVLSNPKIAEAIDAVTKTAEYGVKGGNPNQFETLIAAKKFLDDEYKGQMNAVTGLKKGAGEVTATAANELSQYLKENSPEYKQGAYNYQTAQNRQMQPLREGPVGQIAEGTNAAQILMPTKPVSLYPADIKRTVELLRRKDPAAVPDWTRQQLEATFNETAQNLQIGPNQFGGAKFASTLRGNNQQAKNLEALITSSSGMQAYQGFEKVLDVLEAQGTRQGAGSQTSFNNQFQKELAEGGPLAAAKLVFKPSEVATKYEEWQLNKNSNKLANMLTSPDSIDQLKQLARTGPKTAKGQILINSLLGGYTATKPEITEEQK
jgi:hypothetical protein